MNELQNYSAEKERSAVNKGNLVENLGIRKRAAAECLALMQLVVCCSAVFTKTGFLESERRGGVPFSASSFLIFQKELSLVILCHHISCTNWRK